MEKLPTWIDETTREERSPAVDGGFPCRIDHCDLTKEPGGQCPWHWHNEVELFYMEAGELVYRLPGSEVPFAEGDIGFVNANVLHMTRCVPGKPCRQQEHIFLPGLVGGAQGSAVEQRYVRPLLDGCGDLLIVRREEPEAEEMRRRMDAAFETFRGQREGYELTVRAELSALWMLLLRAMRRQGAREARQEDGRLKAMLRFIEAHYAEPVRLEEIAAAANVSPREGGRCFRRQLGATPFEVLINTRIDRACALLREGSLPVTQVALACGFASPSYFGKLFRERMGMTATAYREAKQKAPA